MRTPNARIGVLTLWVSLLLQGCTSTPPRPTSTLAPEWQGRLSVQVLGDAPSSMAAGFLLRGDAQNGELDLYSPLGTTLGSLEWTPQHVQLSDGKTHQNFGSLAELTEKTTGAALPIEAIFGWLRGRNDIAAGWQVDLSTTQQGSLLARRTSPQPEVMLRIQLDP